MRTNTATPASEDPRKQRLFSRVGNLIPSATPIVAALTTFGILVYIGDKSMDDLGGVEFETRRRTCWMRRAAAKEVGGEPS